MDVVEPDSSITSIHITVTGRVQGVFFRKFTKEEAQRLELTGWVRNMMNGGVEVYAEGEKKKLENLLQWVHRGSPMARVDRVENEWGVGPSKRKVIHGRFYVSRH